ncbi:metal ABC transporter permease, partial [Staphylococcus aureus]|nr:metal ABC transporter permease [Staphylococcus aureus]
AFLTSLLGLWVIHSLERHMRVPSDAALCFVLSTFFGVGLTITSEVQFSFTSLYKQALTYLYGQAATMTDVHIAIYGVLALVVMIMILLF